MQSQRKKKDEGRIVSIEDNSTEAEKYIAKHKHLAIINSDIIEAIDQIKMAIGLGINIFIHGPTGVGKTIVAQLATLEHDKDMPFVSVNASAIPEELFESMLFGYRKGAFTSALTNRDGYFQKANKGILFLDEIGDLTPVCQAKLLSVIESGYVTRVGDTKPTKIDVLVISASNKDIINLPEDEFRKDLYHRVCGLSISIPSLAERREEMEIIAGHFLKDLNLKFKGGADKALSCEVLVYFKKYNWPGNLRELKNKIASAFIKSGKSQKIELIDLDQGIVVSPGNQSSSEEVEKTSLVDNEKRLVIRALEANYWVQQRAAKDLGITNRAMNYKISKYGITHPTWRKNKGPKLSLEEYDVIKDDFVDKVTEDKTVQKKCSKDDEEELFMRILKENSYNQNATARDMNVPIHTVRRLIKKLGLDIASLKKNQS